MKKSRKLLMLLCALMSCLCILDAAAAGPVTAGLLSRVATRTGPGTQYDEPGTYFQNDWRTSTVKVINAAWDDNNDIWWVQVDFSTMGKKFRAYTGLKRVNVDVNILDKESPLGTSTMRSAAKAYWGPGRDYVEAKYNVPNYTPVTVYDVENDFILVEFYDARTAVNEYSLRRAWVTAVTVTGHWEAPKAQPQPQTVVPNVTVQPPAEDAKFQFCPYCGKELPSGNMYLFCPFCGSSLAQPDSKNQ